MAALSELQFSDALVYRQPRSPFWEQCCACVCRLVERGWPRDAETRAVATYVARKAFKALEGDFQSASAIRAWFKKCARIVTKAGATVKCDSCLALRVGCARARTAQ